MSHSKQAAVDAERRQEVRREVRLMRAMHSRVVGPILRRFADSQKFLELGTAFCASRVLLTAVELGLFTELAPADLKVFRRSGLAGRLARAGVGALGDLAYVGIDGLVGGLGGATPRRKPRGRERPPEDRRYNRAFARRRIQVEHAIGQLRRYQALTAVNRHGRKGHAARVRAVVGLVNRMPDREVA